MQTVNEEIKINDTLNPDLWVDNELKEDVKEKLLDIADNFLDALKEDNININVEDIRFLGSNANYNYTDKSDIDLHIVVNLDDIEQKDIMSLLLSAYKTLFNKAYDITINGHEVEIYVEDVNTPAKSNGVYSLYTGWIKEPNKDDIPNIDWEQFELVFDGMEDRYFDVVGEHLGSNVELEENFANNIDKDILDTIKNPLDKLYKNTKCSKSVGTLLDKYFYETDKPLKLCLGNIRHKGDETNSKAITHTWVEVDGEVKETNFPDGDYERVLVDSLTLDRNEDLYNQVEEFLNKPSLREEILYRGVGKVNGIPHYLSVYTGTFYADDESNAEMYGEVSSKDIDLSNMKLYETTTSSQAISDLKLSNYESNNMRKFFDNYIGDCNEDYSSCFFNFEEISDDASYSKLIGWWNDYEELFGEDYDDDNEMRSFNEWLRQIVLKDYLSSQGYDGVHYSEEDGYSQYQLWNEKQLKEDLQQEVDSEGNSLTPEQVEFFKNSKVRDSKGRLLVCYHSTNSDFDVFNNDKVNNGSLFGRGFYFSTNSNNIYSYGSKYKRVYLNSIKPFKYSDMKDEDIQEIIKNYTGSFDDKLFSRVSSLYYRDDLSSIEHYIEEVLGKYVPFDEILKKSNYDGIFVIEQGDMKSDKTEIIAFYPNQIKSIDNKNPSNSNNINEDYDYDKVYQIKELYKKAYDELIDNSTRLHRYREWASNSNNDYKEYIYNDLKNNKKDSALNLWYNHYRLMTGNYDLSYEDFLNTPITLYRATNIKEDEDSSNPFFSYAQDKRGAERFLSQVQNLYGNRSGEIKEIQIKPKDTFGMIPSDENEIIVPNNSYQKRIINIENIVDELINYADTNNVELPYDKDELLDLFKKEGRNTNDFKNQIIKYVDKRKGKLKESKLKESNDYGYHAGDLGKSEGRQQQDGGRGTGHFGTGTYFVGNPDKIKGYNDYQYGKGKAPHHIVDFSSYNLYKPSNNDYGYKLHDTLKLLNNGYKYFTTHKDDLEWFKSHNISASKSGEFEGKDIPEIVKHLNNLIGDYDPIELPKDINFDTIDKEEDELWDKYYDELKPQYKDKGTGEFFDAIDDKVKENPKFAEYHSLIKIVREAIEEELDDRTLDRLNDYTNLVDKLSSALEYRHSKEEIQNALNEVNKNLYSKVGDSLSTIFMKALGYEGIDVRHLQDDNGWAGLDNTTYGSVIYDLKPDTIVENNL